MLNTELAPSIELAPPVASGALLDPAFGRRFTIFADAEEEFDWAQPLRRCQTSTRAVDSLPAATLRLNDRGVIPTYLVDFPVVDTERSAATVRAMVDDGRCTFGTQLHPWVNPPFDEVVSGPNSFAGRLPLALERAKLRVLTERITQVLGSRPLVYRAGRYGVGPNTAALLIEQGYQMDVSVRARFDYSTQGGVNFMRHPIQPYWIAPDLLEVPLTAGFIGMLRRWPGLFDFNQLHGPMAAAGVILIVHVPLLLGCFAALQSLLASFIVISQTEFTVKSSEVINSICMALIPPMFGMILMVPGYAIAALGAVIRSLLGESTEKSV